MKSFRSINIVSLLVVSLLFVQCHQDDDKPIYQDMCNDGIQNGDETGVDCGGSCEPCEVEELFAGEYLQEDQMGRPGTNLLFNRMDLRDSLNTVVPSNMRGQFKGVFKERLLTLDPTFTTNVLGLDADEMADIFSRDVLWVAQTGETTYYNGNEIMTGRALGEDVMDVNLLWIFGGPDGTKNGEDPLLTSDGVSANDAEFLNSFPYLASPF